MGEVGTNSGENPHADRKMNGSLNGSCEDDDIMEVDTSDESIKQNAVDVVATKKPIESDGNGTDKTDAIVVNSKTQSDSHESNDEKSSNGNNEKVSKSEMKNDSVTVQANGKNGDDKMPAQEISDTSIESGGDAEMHSAEDDIEMVDDDDDDDDADSVDDEKNVDDSLVKSTSDTKCSQSDQDDDETTTNGALNLSSKKTNVSKLVIDDEVHAISDSDDDDSQPRNVPAKPTEKATNGLGDGNGVNNPSHTTNNNDVDDDDDRPVSIHSDSESDEEEEAAANSKKNEVHEILSDNEDCVVVGEPHKLDASELAQRKPNRSRKSAVRPREFTDYDDDIEEIIDDPLDQPQIKKPRLNLPNNLPQSLTIQDARSLPNSDPLSLTQQYQQKFAQSLSTNKEPTLVIIDTNSMMNRGTSSTMQALHKQNVSVMPVGVPAQGVYPLQHNIQASITPVPNTNNQLNAGISKTMSSSPTTTTTIAPAAITSPGLSLINAPVLTSLTDDMFVLEAPSFIVPYIYEKPPEIELKEFVEKMGTELKEEEKKKSEKDDVADKDKDKDVSDAKEKDESTDAADGTVDEQATKKSEKKKKKPTKSADDSWDESDTSTDEEASDNEERTKILIKEAKTDLDAIKPIIGNRDPLTAITTSVDNKQDNNNYFESPLGKFFMDIGINLVQEHVQTDLLRQQRRKLHREGNQASPTVQLAINSLIKNLESSKEKNETFKFETKRCEYCNFKSESSLVMAYHYETPHMKGNMYRCNFCQYEVRPPFDILLHMKNEHNIQARLEKALSYHQCPNCMFEDNGKSKLARHALVCVKKFRPEINLAPPTDWESPAKIPRIKPRHGLVGTANAYQAMAAQAQRAATAAAALQRQNVANAAALMNRNRGRPQSIAKTTTPIVNNNVRPNQQNVRPPAMAGGMMLPNNFQFATPGQYIQVPGTGLALLPNVSNVPNTFNLMQSPASKNTKTSQQPSISITALPRPNQSSTTNITPVFQQPMPKTPNMANMKPGQSPQPGGKASFVICEICDGYIKDLDQLRNHMQWMHKVKIHPKMIYNRPPLNCQKCQFRFFTDQGLERHLLGSHGLVTSSMQEAANKGKDAGRCPVCGRMYQWKLLNHVSREHNMTLKPAHLSYKCTVCTATFGMYKQFENHVYSAHSTVAKKAVDNKKSSNSLSSNNSSGLSGRSIGGSGLTVTSTHAGDSLLKPLKINDEITIIPQPASRNRTIEIESHVID